MVKNRFENRARPQLIIGFDAEVAKWVGDQLKVDDFGPCTAIGVAYDGEIVAGVVYHNYVKYSIIASIAAKNCRWANKRILRAIFEYPFGQLGVKNLAVVVDRKNQPVRAFVERLGFKIVGHRRDANDVGDATIYDMIKDECQWYGKEFRAKAA